MDIFMPVVPISSAGRRRASGRRVEPQDLPAALLGPWEKEIISWETPGSLALITRDSTSWIQ